MVNITKISPTKKVGSYNIYLNNKYSFTVLDLVLVKFKLKEGCNLNLALIEQILILELTERFKNFSLITLQSRPKSEKEVEIKINERAKKYREAWPIFNSKDNTPQFLDKKEHLNSKRLKNLSSLLTPNSNILSSRQLEFLMEEKDIQKIFTIAKNNAIEFLKKYNYINDLDFAKWLVEQRSKQGKGKLFIKQDLFKKGVLPDIINSVLSSIDSESSITLVYKKALRKYLSETDVYKKKQKIYRYLLSKGFSYEEILLVIK